MYRKSNMLMGFYWMVWVQFISDDNISVIIFWLAQIIGRKHNLIIILYLSVWASRVDSYLDVM